MEFRNDGDDMKVRIGTKDDGKWVTVKTGESINLPKRIGKRNGFKVVKAEVQAVSEDEEITEELVEVPKLVKRRRARSRK